MKEQEDRKKKPRLLLHSCCGPCSTAVVERLWEEYRITLFFYNPNITEEPEYRRRRETQLEFLRIFNGSVPEEDRVEFLEGDWEPQGFFDAVKGLEDEPEGGIRCRRCFALRLDGAAAAARDGGFDFFGTTLSVSPHKSYPLLCQAGDRGAEQYGVPFLHQDFKKKAGYQRSVELSREYGLYRQNYCGCRFSKWEAGDPKQNR